MEPDGFADCVDQAGAAGHMSRDAGYFHQKRVDAAHLPVHHFAGNHGRYLLREDQYPDLGGRRGSPKRCARFISCLHDGSRNSDEAESDHELFPAYDMERHATNSPRPHRP